ncbi:MAG: helix-turn-helix domain-containing protein [Ilumatobacteraceae bacterium]
MTVLVVAKNLPKDPLAALRVLADSEHELERIRREQVVAARAAGASWQQIGDALGVSRQSAWEAFTAATRSALADNVDANGTLTEHDALDLAVEEVRAVRRRGVTR